MADTTTPTASKARRTATPARSSRPPQAAAKSVVQATKPSKKDKVTSELRLEVKALRATLGETVEHFTIKLGGQIAQLEGVLEGTRVAGTAPAQPDTKTATAMLKEIRSLKVKTKKGRTKDLVRLADLVEDLLDLLPPQP